MNLREQFGRETLPVSRGGLGWIQRFSSKAFAALLALALCGTVSARAGMVTSLADDGSAGTLRYEIVNAAAGDTIDFAVAGTITLESPELTIDKNLTISNDPISNGPVAIDGSGKFRIFFILHGDVTIFGLTIQNGDIGGDDGGGIWNQDTLTLTNSTVSGNTAGQRGGGIYNRGGTVTLADSTVSGNTGALGGGICNDGGTVTLTDSTVSGNSAINGGGIFSSFGTLTLTNSTVSGNSCTGSSCRGGGINNFNGTVTLTDSTVSTGNTGALGGGIYNDGTLTLANSTVSGNSANTGGGGIINAGGTLTLSNSTVSGNSTNGNGGGIWNGDTLDIKNTIVANSTSGGNCYNTQTATSHGHNLSDDATCDFFSLAVGDLTVASGSAGLGPLQDNGGPTETHALLAGSPAIDAVPLADCTDADSNPITTDQRGVARPQGTACDIGAFELSASDGIPSLVTQVLNLNLQNGISNSLDAKLDAALGALDDINAHNDVAAINSLQAFINAVEAQRGGQIEEAEADALIAAAQAIIALLGG